MIFTDSRYADGFVYKAQSARDGNFRTTVERIFPTEDSEFYYYEWVNGDRIDMVAYRQLNNMSYWWKIMDYNPEITDPYNIVPGTSIRIPK